MEYTVIEPLLNLIIELCSRCDDLQNENQKLQGENRTLKEEKTHLQEEKESLQLKLDDKTSSDYLLNKLANLVPDKGSIDEASLQDLHDKLMNEVQKMDKRKQKEAELLRNDRFGKSSEKSQPKETEANSPEQSTKKKRKPPTRKENDVLKAFVGIPPEIILHVLKSCPNCGGMLEAFCVELSRCELVYHPARLELRCHCVEKYICTATETLSEGTQSEIVSAKAPPPLFRGSVASSSVVGRLIHEKAGLGTPYHRLQREWAALGVNLKRDKMAKWCIRATKQYLTPLFERMQHYLIQRDLVMCDETRWYCLEEPNKQASSADWMWVFRSAPDKELPPIHLYLYSRTRKGDNAKTFLEGFIGYLISDGFSGYNKVLNATRCFCYSHLRRYFLEASPLGCGKTPPKGSGAEKGVSYINRILENERLWAEYTPEERYEKRIQETLPILNEFFDWVKRCDGKTDNENLQKAFTYALNNEVYFRNFLKDGRIPLTNNLCEQSVKAVIRQRQSSYFSDSIAGAETTAVAISIVETAVANGIPSEQYLSFVLERLTGQDLTDTNLLDSLLPWSPLVQEHFKVGDTGGTEDVDALKAEVQRQLKGLWQEEKAKKAFSSLIAMDISE